MKPHMYLVGVCIFLVIHV